MPDFETMRAHMVDCQIRPNKVADPRLVDSLAQLPRERFVPESRRAVAYVDSDIEVAPGRWLMEPAVFARLVAETPVGGADAVLDVGCASGYSTAVLGLVAASAIGIEPDPGLAARAGDLLAELGIDNATVVNRPLEGGYPEQAPYDVIFLGGAVDAAPEALSDQLAEGGRLVTVLNGRSAATRHGKAVRFLKLRGRVSQRTLFDAAARPLPGFRRNPGFAF